MHEQIRVTLVKHFSDCFRVVKRFFSFLYFYCIMQIVLFDLNFEHWGIFLLSFIPAFINVGIFLFVVFYLPHNRINRAFSLFVILMGTAQAAEGLMRMSNTIEVAEEWNKISVAPWAFITPFGLLFTLHFTQWEKKISDGLLFILLFFPATIFEFLIIIRLDKYSIIKSEEWNWIVNPEPTFVTNALFLWICGIGLITLALLWIYYFRVKENKRKKMQSLLLAVGFSIPFVGGVISEVIFPLVFGLNSIPLTTPLITAFSITSLIAIRRYDLMDYSPHRQWDKIIEAMNEGVLIVNNEDRIMYANEKFCSIVGYKFNEIEGQIAKKLFLDNQDAIVQMEKIIEKRKNSLSSQNELQLKTKSGKKIWMLVSGSPCHDRKGTIVGSIGIHTDISILKKSQRELNDTLNEMNTFIYKTSHDLKAPLCSLEGLISLAETEIKSPESNLYFGMISKCTRKMKNLLTDLTSIIMSSKGEIRCEAIDFEQLIDDIKKGMRFLPGFAEINFVADIKQINPFHSDKRFLSTILQNLLNNAIKFKKNNYDFVSSYIHIYIKEDALGVRIEISDNGIGIPENFQEKVFDMFFRGTEISAGSGLGLYIVKTTVKKLKGKIELKCEKKQTTFIVLLPDLMKYVSDQTHDFKSDPIKCFCK